MDPLAIAKTWAADTAFDPAFRKEIQDLIDKNDQSEIEDRFYKDLEFGTGGIRGIVGAGRNRMNVYNIQTVTQGLADYCKQQSATPSVVIGYDSRLSSADFSKKVAEVLAGNGVKVHVFLTVHPTPYVSFAIRFLKATAGIVITASHNPPEYNGYKVSWSDGAQVTAPHDVGIIEAVRRVDSLAKIQRLDWEKAITQGLIQPISDACDEAYGKQLESILTQTEQDALQPERKKEKEAYAEKILYTPLHGVGFVFVDRLFKKFGFGTFQKVESQVKPDGNFPTLKSPNPESEKAFDEAKKIATSDSLFVLATDPDADRLGVIYSTRNHAEPKFNLYPLPNDSWYKFSGNQIGQILLYNFAKTLQERNALPKKAFVVSTIVSSELGKKIALSFGLDYFETLTGFKNINAKLAEKESEGRKYLFGYEESFGYQFGDFLREKDGISACLMFSQLDFLLRKQQKTFLHSLEEIYAKHGFHYDELVDLVLPGSEGSVKIQKVMEALRAKPPQKIAGEDVVQIKDYLKLTSLDTKTNQTTALASELKSNVLAIYLANGTRITARPSGTEPKIKFYFNFSAKSREVLVDFCRASKEEYLSYTGLK